MSHFPPTSSLLGENFIHGISYFIQKKEEVDIRLSYREEKQFQNTYYSLRFKNDGLVSLGT